MILSPFNDLVSLEAGAGFDIAEFLIVATAGSRVEETGRTLSIDDEIPRQSRCTPGDWATKKLA